ncbi:hypothetical protein GCM10010327_40570 [Streptomyces nitrosporeus]|nr:hypothetical protein GCM10010327_40570 [Streptomyces nitrosporeus]
MVDDAAPGRVVGSSPPLPQLPAAAFASAGLDGLLVGGAAGARGASALLPRVPASALTTYTSQVVGEFAGPVERRPSMQPSRQARRQRSTDRTLTGSFFAITVVFSPAANRCPA